MDTREANQAEHDARLAERQATIAERTQQQRQRELALMDRLLGVMLFVCFFGLKGASAAWPFCAHNLLL